MITNLNTEELKKALTAANSISDKLENCIFSGKPINKEEFNETELDIIYLFMQRLIPDIEFELEERECNYY